MCVDDGFFFKRYLLNKRDSMFIREMESSLPEIKPHCKPIPVMKTGFSLCTFSHREKPVSISWDPCNENRFFPVGKKYTGKSLFWPCTDPVRDCSVVKKAKILST